MKPKIEKVSALEIESEKARKALEKEERELKKLEEILSQLNDKYENAMKDRQRLQEETDLLQKRLIAADKLIGGLSSENERWEKEAEHLRENIDDIYGNCLLSSSFLTYCGPFTYEFRSKMIFVDWKEQIVLAKIPMNADFKLETELTDDVEISR